MAVRPEDYGAVGDGTTNDTTAMQSFFDNSSKAGVLTAGMTYLVSGVTVPADTCFEGDLTGPMAVIKRNSTSAGQVLSLDGSGITLRNFAVDGGESSNTYTTQHHGISVPFVSAGSPKQDITLEGLVVKNCGYDGIYMRNVTRAKVLRCRISRCGYAGVEILAGHDCETSYNFVENIYPGETSSRNAYGITHSHSELGSDRRTRGFRCNFNTVNYVPTWEGLDEHDASDGEFIGNRISNCAQGIALQHTYYAAKNIRILNNAIEGYTNSSVPGSSSEQTKVISGDGTFYMTAGIVANNDTSLSQGIGLIIEGNQLWGTGDTRTSASGSGAIKVRYFRNVAVCGNSIYNAYSAGIALESATGSTGDSILYATVNGNSIDAVTEINGSRYGILAFQRVMGVAVGNFVSGAGSNAFFQHSTVVYTMTYANNVQN